MQFSLTQSEIQFIVLYKNLRKLFFLNKVKKKIYEKFDLKHQIIARTKYSQRVKSV